MPVQISESTGHRLHPARFIKSPSNLIIIFSAIFALVSLSACGEEPNKKPNVIINNNPGDTGKNDVGYDDNSPTDTGKKDVEELTDTDDSDTEIDDQDTRVDPDTRPEDDTNVPPDSTCNDSCLASEICVVGECVKDTADRKCRDATNLGQLKLGVKKTAEGTLRRVSDVISTTCGPGDNKPTVGAEAVFKFTVEQDSRIDFDAKWLGQFDGVIAFHTDSCKIPGSSMDPCFDHEKQSFHALAGHDYFMVVELTVGRGHDFTVDLTAQPVDCIPGANGNSCTDGVFSRCEGAGVTETYACASTCTGSGTECRGNSCAEPIVVTASTTFTGHSASYDHRYDFQNIPGCEVNGTPIPTPGQEIVFSLPDLQAGDVVTINSNRVPTFISSTCGSPSELRCVATAYDSEDPLVWTVPETKGYFIFIDQEVGNEETFQYSIDIQ